MSRAMCPTFYLGPGNKYYLIAMFNQRSYADYQSRAQNPNDDLIAAAREAMFIPKNLEHTLQWYRYPMSWAKPDL